MNLETFFEKFELFADAPDAVAKMRELVLELAVRGKLVDQLPSDEPAYMLLGRIQRSKERLVKERAIRRQETEPIDYDSVPFPIPQTWVWTRLGEVGDWGSGSTPPRGGRDLYDGGVTWLKSGELNDNLALAGSSETVTELALKTGSFRRNQPGDVLFAMYGATIGKVAILAEPAVTNQAVCGCTPFEGVSNRYLFTYLISQRAAFHEASEGGAQPNLSKVKIVAFLFPLPPLAEQKRIVAKVDELMALCDQLEAQQREREQQHTQLARASLDRFTQAPTVENLNFIFHKSFDIMPAELRKTILTLAVQGKLVPQDPDDEPAEASIERVSKDAKKAIRDGIIRRHGLEKGPDDTDLSGLPFGWRWTRLAEVTRPLKYAIKRGPFGSAIRKDMFVATGLKVYEQQHAISGDFTKGHYFISEAKFDELSAFELHPGEVLVSCSGTVGKVAIVPANIERGIINQALLKLSLHQSALLNEYFLILFPAYFMETDTLTNLSGTAQKNIPSMDVLKSMPFPLPPLAEQRRIVAKVDQLMKLVDELEAQISASRASASKLLNAIVAELTT